MSDSGGRNVLTLGVAAVAATLLIAAFAMRQRLFTTEVHPTPAAPRAVPLRLIREALPAPTRPQEPGASDLLSLIRLDRDVVEGAWGFEGAHLVSPSVPWARLQIPIVPPEEYDLRLSVVRREGTNSFNVGLVAGGRQVLALLDGWVNADLSGLDIVQDKPFYENVTTSRGRRLPKDRKVNLLCLVRRGSISVQVDGQTVIDWKGDTAALSLLKQWEVPKKEHLFLGSYASSFSIEEAVLLPAVAPDSGNPEK
jgi:hypothetical protein